MAYQSRIPADAEYIQSVGRAFYNFTYLEWVVVWTIVKLSADGFGSVPMGKPASFIAKAMIKAIDSTKPPLSTELRFRLVKFHEAYLAAIEKRNKLLHAHPPAYPTPGGSMATFSDELKYESAIALRTAESSVFWSMTQTYLLGETLLAAFLVQAPESSSLLLRQLVAILGVAVGILWVTSTQRIAAYHTLRVTQGKALEVGDSAGLFSQETQVKEGLSAKRSAVVLAVAFVLFFVVVLLERTIRG